jgi:hypothetical protein
MQDNPFLITNHIEMLAKAERELSLLRAAINVDTVFNCFVSVYHVMDYVQALSRVDKSAIDAMYADPDFDLCHSICNRGKHLTLRRNPKIFTSDESGGSGMLGFGAIGEDAISAMPEWHFYCDGVEIYPVELAEIVIKKWHIFFHANGIG